MMQMSVSDQIISVIDDLCRKFGIAINWTAGNVVPYIEELCQRYIKYEIYTSVAWCAMCSIIVFIFAITWIITAARYKKDSGLDDANNLAMIMFWIALSVSIIISAVQAFDIIECMTIPEKVIFDYLNLMIKTR